ncbi:Putative nuclease, partial [Frankliniella fusca]
ICLMFCFIVLLASDSVHYIPNFPVSVVNHSLSLSLYANGSYQRMIGKSIDCSVSQTSVSRFVREITDALNHPDVLTNFIKFPLTAEERAPIIARDERLGMPRVLGFIDGTLIRLTQLPHDVERQAFFCRKGYLALNCQVICDSDLNIMNVDARWPGSANDRFIWNASAARAVDEQAYWEDRCWLLVCCLFLLQVTLATLQHHGFMFLSLMLLLGLQSFFYTRLHCQCRNVVERCIGVLKSRFRILGCDRAINFKNAAYAGNIVNACCVLHNFCIRRGLPNPQPFYDNPNDDFAPQEPEYLPLNVAMRGIYEMNYLINYVNRRREQ